MAVKSHYAFITVSRAYFTTLLWQNRERQNGLISLMLFSELFENMVNEVTFVSFTRSIAPIAPTLDPPRRHHWCHLVTLGALRAARFFAAKPTPCKRSCLADPPFSRTCVRFGLLYLKFPLQRSHWIRKCQFCVGWVPSRQWEQLFGSQSGVVESRRVRKFQDEIK